MSTLTQIVNRWGLIKGFKMYYRIKKIKSGSWTLPELKHPVHLRPNTTDSIVFKQVFGKGEYDISYNFIPQTIIDGGGNIGLFSVLMTNRYPEARIYGIEPDPLNFRQFQKNTSPYPNIFPINAGIWHKSCFLAIVDEGYGQYALRVKEVENGIETDLRGISIVDLMTQYNLESLDIVKLDVEGAEAMIFSDNYDKWLSCTKVLIIELHQAWLPGSSDNFEAAIKKYPFTRTEAGEYLVYTRHEAN